MVVPNPYAKKRPRPPEVQQHLADREKPLCSFAEQHSTNPPQGFSATTVTLSHSNQLTSQINASLPSSRKTYAQETQSQRAIPQLSSKQNSLPSGNQSNSFIGKKGNFSNTTEGHSLNPCIIKPITCSASAAKSSSTDVPASASQSLDCSFDDGGIDWTIALQQLDTAAQQRMNSKQDSQPIQCSPSLNAVYASTKSSIPSQIHQSLPATMKADPTLPKPAIQSSTTTLERPSQWNNEQPLSDPSSSTQTLSAVARILQYDRERVIPVDDAFRSSLVKSARLSQPLNNGWTLFSHQKKAILRALLMRRIILALDMGLGKTLIGCVWARAFQETYGESLKVICISPVSLLKEWKRTAEEATGIVVGESPDPDSVLMDICSWAKIPERVSASQYVILCDEAHSMQSLDAARTKAVLKLAKPSRCVGVLLLTGTPMKNGKPTNLFPLLRAVKHPFGDDQKEYERYFCDGREKSFGRGRVVWDANGCSNLGELREHISSHLMHMTKEECLGQLPPQTRVIRHVQVSSKHQLQHNEALNKLASMYASTGSLGDGDAILTAVTKVRQIGSFAKIDATVALTKQILQDEPAVVIFSSFATVVKLVHKRLADSGWTGELLTGETPAKKRQGMVDKFQQGLSPVFVSTFGAGGVGLTLTAAHTIILLDRPWTPGEARQAEDRVRRIGQTKPVTSIWMVAFDLDKQIDSILQQKTNTTNAVLADGEQKGGAAPKISVFAMLKSVFGSNYVQK